MENKNHFWISSMWQENQKSDYEMGLTPLLTNYFIIIIEIVNLIYMDIEKIRKYKNDFDKENYKQFKAKLKPNEMEEINEFLEKNNMNKREFVKDAYKMSVLKKEIKNIVSKFQLDYEMPASLKLSNGKRKHLDNGIAIYSYTFPVLNDEKMLVLRIEFNDEILYYGVVNYNRSPQILEEIEKIDTSF